MCFFFLNPGPVWRVPIPNRYTAKAKLCFCKNNKRRIIIVSGQSLGLPENLSLPMPVMPAIVGGRCAAVDAALAVFAGFCSVPLESLVCQRSGRVQWLVPLITQTLLSWARPWLVRVFQTRRTLPPPATLLEGAETAVSLFTH